MRVYVDRKSGKYCVTIEGLNDSGRTFNLESDEAWELQISLAVAVRSIDSIVEGDKQAEISKQVIESIKKKNKLIAKTVEKSVKKEKVSKVPQTNPGVIRIALKDTKLTAYGIAKALGYKTSTTAMMKCLKKMLEHGDITSEVINNKTFYSIEEIIQDEYN